jgi:glycosyltransferase involved in cell wall biosynthesis
MIEVSVVVPARNEAAYVAAALGSVAAQGYPAERIETVVAVNGSRDATADVVRRWSAAHPDRAVTVIEDPIDGVARAKNAGARAATGRVLVFLDADSLMAPDLVERVVVATSNGSPAGSIPIRADSSDLLDRGFFGLLEYGKRLFGIRANMLFCRRDVFEAAGGFDERLHQAEDRDLLVRLQRSGVVVSHLVGTWIATSPRRLHEGPLRIGMLRVFARWSLGHAGIWRDRPY